MSPRRLHLIVPGPLDQRTGGYLYDAHMVRGLRARGWAVEVHELPGRFPAPDAEAESALEEALAAAPEGALVVIDGLAMGGLPGPVHGHADRVRLVGLVHHPLADETGLGPQEIDRFERSERRALEACVGVIVTSATTAERLRDFGVAAERVRAVLPGTDRAEPAIGPGPEDPPRLLCVATITPRKGHDVLVRALDRVRDRPWSCVLAGDETRDPDFAERVRQAVAEAGLEDRIAFVGEHERDELDRLYRSSSLFVLASHYEGYGMALAEALARGLPIVSTTGGAIPGTVPADAGILVPPGDPDAFAEALDRMLDPESSEREQRAAAARRHAQSLPTWDDAVDGFAAALLELTRTGDA